MKKNPPELMKKKSSIFKSEIIENHQPDINNDPAMSTYEMALFKKRIMWKATIFALKIVIPVVILAIILIKFLE
jgi:hypothetical protein